MSAGELQQGIDRLAMVSSQRWLFGVIAVVAAVVASAASAGSSGFAVVLVLGVAVAAVVRPDSHTAAVVGIVVVWQWIVRAGDVADPIVVVVASALFVFHTVIALMAVTPSSAIVDRVLVWRWLRRCGLVLVATLSMWLIVAVMVNRQAPGSVLLTFLAFVALGGFTVVIRALGVTAGEQGRGS